MLRVSSGVYLGVFALSLVGCGENDGVGTSSGELAGSQFESADGNLVVNNTSDWANAPALVTKNDLPSGTGDNAFGQGAKEDNPMVTVVNGSIPPNKSDLTRFYISHENVNGSFFLYLAWERSNVLGNANMDFEFNQAPQTLADSTTGAVTIKRTAGDILITYDFGGNGAPDLGLLRWLTADAGNVVSQCYSANALPCWGNRIDLSAAGYADGAVNTTTVTDPVESPAIQVAANEFGEAAINLTVAGVFPPEQCVNLASAFLKSRSSSSFTSEVKDFIAPATANITNCGAISVRKTDGTNALAGAGFKLFDGTPTGTTCSGTTEYGTCTTDANGNCSLGTNIPFGTYCVAETTTPANYFTANAKPATISAAASSVTVDFVDMAEPGALVIKKTNESGTALANAQFSVTLGSATIATVTTDATGQVCLTGLTIGATYTVTETVAPPGYSIDTTSQPATIAAYAQDCTSASATVVTFTDSPLSGISCQFNSPAGATATYVCESGATATSFTSFTLADLPPGTYNCTFVITAN